MTPHEKRKINFWATIIVLVVVGMFIYSNATAHHGPTVEDATAECQLKVRDQLKAPSSADFPLADAASEDGTNRFVVSGAVDAQNSFGAQIRSSYQCHIQYNTDGDRAVVTVDYVR